MGSWGAMERKTALRELQAPFDLNLLKFSTLNKKNTFQHQFEDIIRLEELEFSKISFAMKYLYGGYGSIAWLIRTIKPLF